MRAGVRAHERTTIEAHIRRKRHVPTALDETAELYDRIYINAGQRGLLLSIAPADAVKAAEMMVVDLTA